MKEKSKLNQVLEDNAVLGAEIVKDYLLGNRAGTDQVKVAQQSITQNQKHCATTGATDALKYQMFRDVSKDQKELKGYIKSSFPEMREVKLLK